MDFYSWLQNKQYHEKKKYCGFKIVLHTIAFEKEEQHLKIQQKLEMKSWNKTI